MKEPCQTAVGEPNRSRYQRHREPDLEVSSEVHWTKSANTCK